MYLFASKRPPSELPLGVCCDLNPPFLIVKQNAFFLIKQLVVNSKKIGGSAARQTKRIEKDRSALVSFLSTQLTIFFVVFNN